MRLKTHKQTLCFEFEHKLVMLRSLKKFELRISKGSCLFILAPKLGDLKIEDPRGQMT